MKNYILLFAVPGILLCGCFNNCDDISPPLVLIQISLIDESTGLSLIGEGREYDPDSIASLNDNFSFFQFASTDTVIRYELGLIPSGTSTILRLSPEESDTLRADYFQRETDCFTVPTLSAFYYNGIAQNIENKIFVIEN